MLGGEFIIMVVDVEKVDNIDGVASIPGDETDIAPTTSMSVTAATAVSVVSEGDMSDNDSASDTDRRKALGCSIVSSPSLRFTVTMPASASDKLVGTTLPNSCFAMVALPKVPSDTC